MTSTRPGASHTFTRPTTPTIIISYCSPLKNKNGSIIGTIETDSIPSALINLMAHSNNTGPFIRAKYLISYEGKISVDNSSIYSPTINAKKTNIKQFPNTNFFKKMWSLLNGTPFKYEPKQTLFFFQYLTSLDCLYVKKIDFRALPESY